MLKCECCKLERVSADGDGEPFIPPDPLDDPVDDGVPWKD